MARIGLQLATDLAAIHAEGQAHGEISAATIFVQDDGSVTLASPGLTPATAADDIGALGSVLLLALTGREGEAAWDAHESLDPTWVALLAYMTESNPEDRPAAHVVVRVLQTLAHAENDPRGAVYLYPPWPTAGIGPRRTALVAMAMALALFAFEPWRIPEQVVQPPPPETAVAVPETPVTADPTPDLAPPPSSAPRTEITVVAPAAAGGGQAPSANRATSTMPAKSKAKAPSHSNAGGKVGTTQKKAGTASVSTSTKSPKATKAKGKKKK